MKVNTNSNTYTIAYATVIVIVVAVLLALVSQLLGPRQQANVRLDQQKQILGALKQDVEACADPAALYNSLVTDTMYVKSSENDSLPIYIASIDGEPKFVLKLKGAGLWGGIGGYMALNRDRNTIYGINFNHESETPGLGAMIVEKPFREQFEGKHIRNAAGEIVSVAVLKKGTQAEGQEQVDALSGATITSTGVSDMLKANLSEYSEFLNIKPCCKGCCRQGQAGCCRQGEQAAEGCCRQAEQAAEGCCTEAGADNTQIETE